MPSDALRALEGLPSVALAKEGELTVSQVEPLFDSVIRTYYKLDELGIKEVDGQIVFIDNMEVSHE